MTETIPYDVSYNRWRCDFSGVGGLNNIDDRLTWTVTKITSSNYWTPTADLDTNVDIIGKLNVGNLNNTAHTQASTLDVSGDVSISGKLIVDGAIASENIKLNQEIELIKIFDNSYATTSNGMDIVNATPWIQHKNVLFGNGSILFHNIKVSGFISKKYDFTWPENGHRFILTRSAGENLTSSDSDWYWDSSLNIDFKDFKHTFNTQGEHEESTFSMSETVPYEISYNSWRCDISGDGGLNNIDDKLTWTITKITSIPYFTPIEKNSLIVYDVSSNGLSSFTDVSIQHLNVVGLMEGDISSNGLSSFTDVSIQHLNVGGLMEGDISSNGLSSFTDVSIQHLNVVGLMEGDISSNGLSSFTDVSIQHLNVGGLMEGDISSNGLSSFTDVSIQQLNVVGLMEGDISSNDISVNNLNVNVIDKLNNTNVSFLPDVSFENDV